MNEVVLDAIRHNNWATRQLVVFCRDRYLSKEQLTLPRVGTFGSILATLRHIITADGSYARRLADSALVWVDSDESADLQKLGVWAEEAERLWERILSMPIDVERVIIVDDGLREVRAGVFVAQALNHANHHRGQICAILRDIGIELPDLQAWEYAWATGRIWDRNAVG